MKHGVIEDTKFRIPRNIIQGRGKDRARAQRWIIACRRDYELVPEGRAPFRLSGRSIDTRSSMIRLGMDCGDCVPRLLAFAEVIARRERT
jgi:hypothetical protein